MNAAFALAGQHHPRLLALWLVHPHPRHRHRRPGRRAGGASVSRRADGDMDRRCITEVSLSERREAELSRAGFIPLLHRKNTDFAAFVSAQSLQSPAAYADADATANAIAVGPAAVSARLLPVRAIFEVHGARQDRLQHVAGTAHRLAAGLAAGLYRRLADHLVGRVEGGASAGRRRGGDRAAGGHARAIRGPVLPAPALPARGHGRFAPPGLALGVNGTGGSDERYRRATTADVFRAERRLGPDHGGVDLRPGRQADKR